MKFKSLLLVIGFIPTMQNTVTIQRNSNTIQAVGAGANGSSPEGTVTVTHQDGYTNTLTLD